MSEQESGFQNLNDNGDNHISDEEIERALADFENEFQEQETSSDHETSGDDTDTEVGADLLDHHAFEQELQGLIGNQAKAAVIITRLASAELLAAFCQLADLSACCLDASEGAVAVLKNIDGDGPEAAVKDLTAVVSGLSAVLVVNRADTLEAKLWIDGQCGQSFPPPVLFATSPSFVEDLLIGTSDVSMLKEQGVRICDSGELNRDKAISIIAAHIRFNKGNQTDSGSIE
jgi:hypothetical protein